MVDSASYENREKIGEAQRPDPFISHPSGNPKNVAYDVQTYAVPAESGGMFEFRVPEAGKYLLVDQDKLSQLPKGLVIPIVAR